MLAPKGCTWRKVEIIPGDRNSTKVIWHKTKASWEQQPCAPAGSQGVTRTQPDPSKAPGLRGTVKGVRGGQEQCQVPPAQVCGITTMSQNSPTNRTSRSDFTGLLLKLFSTGHSFSWLQAQTLDVLLSCNTNPQGMFRQPGTAGSALGRLHRESRGASLDF